MMMKKEIKVTWLAPDSWSELTKFRINEALITNGYATEEGFITDGGTIPWGFRNTFNPTGKGFQAFIHSAVNKCI